MPLGWIDFSKTERSKVLSVLELLSEPGTLDELGIAPVRDGFSNLFFPGTTTIQTRAKYFLIVPYALKDLEYSEVSNQNIVLRRLDEIERQCGEQFLANEETVEGIIGNRALAQKRWVKRTPADIYWAGLRTYGIFTGGTLSLSEYVRAMCSMKKQKRTLVKLGNHNDAVEDGESDDKDAGQLFEMQFWKIPTYHEKWMDDLSIRLTRQEGEFLKTQIVSSQPNSMIAYILRNNLVEILHCRSFQDLKSLIHTFPEQIEEDYVLAYDFSHFLFVLRTLYNIVISEGENEAANMHWGLLQNNLEIIACVDLEKIFGRLQVFRNTFLCKFLLNSQKLMKQSDVEGMKVEIKRRERELKQSRAKTLHSGEFDSNIWFGGGELDYRFGNAKTIIRDIFESEGVLC